MAIKLLESDPRLFLLYHEGFRAQVNSWPSNPLDSIIKFIKLQDINKVVGDFGCGEARLQASVRNKVYSFDLIAANDKVITCDISNVPLSSASLDIAVYCLALMGTNFIDFLIEGHRVLKLGGTLKVAEVASRITSIKRLISLFNLIGFKIVELGQQNSYFVELEFVKARNCMGSREKLMAYSNVFRPCLYKRR
ncbi:ribosomal RNA-processing protein 8-like [Zophobas morio]|uniref:ribosomal RNA-processing protein 8-like n=1 Tax=Zophobas morio TaxID=2755281 RepID=UPI0030838280